MCSNDVSLNSSEDTCTSQTSLEPGLLQKYASSIVERNMVPFATGDKKIDQKMAYSIVLLNTKNYDGCIEQLTSLLKDNPNIIGAYHVRGAAYAKKGFQSADSAIADLSKAIQLQPNAPEGWERRAEIYMSLGRTNEALADLTTAITLVPSAKAYAHRGTVHFKEENYLAAEEDFQKSLELDSKQSEIMHFRGLALYHQGKIKDSIEVFNTTLKLEPLCVDCRRSLGHAYRELGDFETSMQHFNTALSLQEDHVQSLQLRGSLLYQSGRPLEALKDFNKCLSVDSTNEACEYMRGLSHASIGQYYEAVKSNAKVQSNPPFLGQKTSNEFARVLYIREYSRYLHARLDTPVAEYSMDLDLQGAYKDNWAKGLPFKYSGYEEQPGLSPEINDVEVLDFDDLPADVQNLICTASSVGSMMQYEADGFLPNVRVHLAMGLAVIEIAQTIQHFWKASKISKNQIGRKWREIFDIAVKWRRVIDPDQPVLWLDLMPSKSIQAGFNSHMHLVRGQVNNVRYTKYFDVVFNVTKKMVAQYGVNGNGHRRSEREILSTIDKITTCEELLKFVKKLKGNRNGGPGFMVATKLNSRKDKSQRYDGVMFTMTGDGNGILFSIDTATTKKRTEQYHSELEYIWGLLTEEARKGQSKDMDVHMDAVINLILSLVYYFYNLMPLSRGSSVVAYSVAMGLTMAAGKEVSGKIAKGKLVDLEAMLTGNPDAFIAMVKSWMNLQRSTINLSSLPKMHDTFPTLRTMLEALNAGADMCNTFNL
uniref:Tetratricopeptide repeat protein 13-like n=1 Tax=Saccoglossus kowalevskii TaxID=10224 RepID=A0ABM0MH04_SACKO|nr:PREDICTED: tetratricopeptide repeat protein 13-like [Saccoglossus kowalevskii]